VDIASVGLVIGSPLVVEIAAGSWWRAGGSPASILWYSRKARALFRAIEKAALLKFWGLCRCRVRLQALGLAPLHSAIMRMRLFMVFATLTAEEEQNFLSVLLMEAAPECARGV
jgi:hypothetical protein